MLLLQQEQVRHPRANGEAQVNWSDLSTNQLVGAVLLAIAAAAVKYLADHMLTQRKDRLERVSRQLEYLYGPLLALTHASHEAWQRFRSFYRPGGAFFDPTKPLTPEEAQAWGLWMTKVFMPLNEKIEALILQHAHLLDEGGMPQCLLDLCAHVEAYKGVMAEWEKGDFSHPTSGLNYPAKLLGYAHGAYAALREQQARLLGRRWWELWK
jgi:hypothetical protein